MQYDQRIRISLTTALYAFVYGSYECFKKCNATYDPPCIPDFLAQGRWDSRKSTINELFYAIYVGYVTAVCTSKEAALKDFGPPIFPSLGEVSTSTDPLSSMPQPTASETEETWRAREEEGKEEEKEEEGGSIKAKQVGAPTVPSSVIESQFCY
jgi:hypothetical protein